MHKTLQNLMYKRYMMVPEKYRKDFFVEVTSSNTNALRIVSAVSVGIFFVLEIIFKVIFKNNHEMTLLYNQEALVSNQVFRCIINLSCLLYILVSYIKPVSKRPVLQSGINVLFLTMGIAYMSYLSAFSVLQNENLNLFILCIMIISGYYLMGIPVNLLVYSGLFAAVIAFSVVVGTAEYSMLTIILYGFLILIVGLFLSLVTFKGYARAFMNKKQLQEQKDQLEIYSYTDALTGIYNRRFFNEIYDREWKRCQREDKYISIIMFDIDHFKKYNDTYGHLKGDECLKQVAVELAKCANRPADVISRMGGEEFIIILPDTDPAGALYVVEKAVIAINELGIENKKSNVADGLLSISAGAVTVSPSLNPDSEELIKVVDRLLYDAKKNGRNQFKYTNLDNELFKPFAEQKE